MIPFACKKKCWDFRQIDFDRLCFLLRSTIWRASTAASTAVLFLPRRWTYVPSALSSSYTLSSTVKNLRIRQVVLQLAWFKYSFDFPFFPSPWLVHFWSAFSSCIHPAQSFRTLSFDIPVVSVISLAHCPTQYRGLFRLFPVRLRLLAVGLIFERDFVLLFNGWNVNYQSVREILSIWDEFP